MLDTVKDTLRNVMDTWSNALTGMGNGARDRRVNTEIARPMRLDWQQLEDLYAANGLAQKICGKPPLHQLANWFQLDTNKEATNTKFQAYSERFEAPQTFIYAETMARLHGGAVIIIGADDGKSPTAPLDEKNIKSIKWLTVLTRWEIEPVRYFADPFAANYGQPEMYKILSLDVPNASTATYGQLVHASRVIAFDGTISTKRRRQENNGWADSVFIQMYERLRSYGHVEVSTESILTDWGQPVYHYDGLKAISDPEGRALIMQRLEMVNVMRSVMGMMIIDKDAESYERVATPVGGLADVVDRVMLQFAAAADMPATVLFGQSPAGQNATGKSDLQLWYDRLSVERSLYIEPKVKRFVTLVLRAKDGPTKGALPQWAIKWHKMYVETEKEQTENRKRQAEIDHIYIADGVVSPAEVRQSRYGGPEFSYESQLQSDTVLPPEAKRAAKAVKSEPKPKEKASDDPASTGKDAQTAA